MIKYLPIAALLTLPLSAQEMTDDERISQMEKRVAEECLVQAGSKELCGCIATETKANMVEKEYRFVMIAGYYMMNFALVDLELTYDRFGYTLADNEGIMGRLKVIEDAAEEKCEALHPITPAQNDGATNLSE